MDYFDLTKAVKAANLNPSDLQQLADLMRREFPGDVMMQELHLLRACMAIAEGNLTLADALRPFAETAA